MWSVVAVFSALLLGRSRCCFSTGSRDGKPKLTSYSLVGVQASSARLIFNGEGMIVNPGERLYLDCGVEGKYRSCIWEKGGDQQQTFQVEDVHEGLWKGMSRPESMKGNECGIVINSVTPNDNGEWTCKVFVVAKTLTGSKSIVVTIKPQPPTLKINESPLVIAENEERVIECQVAAARPAARIRWLIGTEDFTSRSHTEATPTDDMGTYRSVSVLKHRFIHADDRKNLKCLIEHQTLHEPEYSDVPLDIRYKPYPISSQEIYGIPVDSSEYEIKFNFTSNPVPEMKWYIADDEIPVPSERGRYFANIKSHIFEGNLMDNIYMATLKIQDFTPDDVHLMYKLTAKNELGETKFEITLSTSSAPPDTIGSGSLAAIIVIVLLILIILFIIGLMRYRQMYCFAMRAESKAYIQDPERMDYENCRTNEAIKSSVDQLNGRPESGVGVVGVINGNGNINSTTLDNNTNKIETIPHQHHQPHYINVEKKNTDV